MEEFAYVVIEVPEATDCSFISAWMLKVADAQALFMKAAVSEPSLRQELSLLWDHAKPNLAQLARFIVEQFQQYERVITLNVDGPEGIGTAMLVQLRFLVHRGLSYRLAIPSCVTVANIKQAALRVLSTAEDLGFGQVIQPERLLRISRRTEAETWCADILQARSLLAVSISGHEPKPDRISAKSADDGRQITEPKGENYGLRYYQ